MRRMQIGDVLRKIREGRGERLLEVALRAGTDGGNLSRIERNEQRPSLDLLERLADALETPVSTLYQAVEGKGPVNDLGEQGAPGDYGNTELTRLLRYWRMLTPANRRMAVDILKVMSKSQREVADQGPGAPE